MDARPTRTWTTMAGLAALVVLLAADSALLRYLSAPDKRGLHGEGLKAYLLVVLPLLNAVVLGLPRLVRRGRWEDTPFLAGFEAAGWAAVVGYGIAGRLFPISIGSYFVQVFAPVYNTLADYSSFGSVSASELFMWFVMFPACSLALSLPLWGIAVSGGVIGRWAGLAARNRRESAAVV